MRLKADYEKGAWGSVDDFYTESQNLILAQARPSERAYNQQEVKSFAYKVAYLILWG